MKAIKDRLRPVFYHGNGDPPGVSDNTVSHVIQSIEIGIIAMAKVQLNIRDPVIIVPPRMERRSRLILGCCGNIVIPIPCLDTARGPNLEG
jgi:hypothetical protein